MADHNAENTIKDYLQAVSDSTSEFRFKTDQAADTHAVSVEITKWKRNDWFVEYTKILESIKTDMKDCGLAMRPGSDYKHDFLTIDLTGAQAEEGLAALRVRTAELQEKATAKKHATATHEINQFIKSAEHFSKRGSLAGHQLLLAEKLRELAHGMEVREAIPSFNLPEDRGYRDYVKQREALAKGSGEKAI